MCHFITLVVPTDDVDALRSVMVRFGRDARPIDNPSVAKALTGGERQFLTNRRGCDCGTVLAVDHAHGGGDGQEREAARLARKSWSKAKIERALEARKRADARPTKGPDTLELWADILSRLQSEMKLAHAGLLVHAYSGGLEDEAFSVARRDVPPGMDVMEGLQALRADEVTVFRTH